MTVFRYMCVRKRNNMSQEGGRSEEERRYRRLEGVRKKEGTGCKEEEGDVTRAWKE